MKNKYLVILRHKNFIKRLFSFPNFIFCQNWTQVEKIINYKSKQYYIEVEFLNEINI